MFEGLFALIGGAISGVLGLFGGLFNPAPAPQDFVKFDDPVVIEEKKEVENAEEIEETAAPALVDISPKTVKSEEAQKDKDDKGAIRPVLGE